MICINKVYVINICSATNKGNQKNHEDSYEDEVKEDDDSMKNMDFEKNLKSKKKRNTT
jgi:hypothetical protein